MTENVENLILEHLLAIRGTGLGHRSARLGESVARMEPLAA